MPNRFVSTALFACAAGIVLSGAASSVSGAEERPVPCRTNAHVIAACFTVHGSMSAHNGAPTFRIWDAVTHRILGVHGDQDGLPPSLIPVLMQPNGDAFGKIFDGDYTVCPFTRERAGRMRMVCVEGATHVKVRWIEH